MKDLARKWTIGLALAGLTLAPVLAEGRGGGWTRGERRGPGHHGGPGFGERMAEKLGLSEEQRTQVREITRKHMDSEMGDRLEAMREAHEALDVVIHDPLATDAQVQQAASAVASQMALVATERHHMAVEIASVLTPEQRQKFAEMRQHRGDGRRGPRGARPDSD